jgi:hypothetical protein
MYLFLGSPEDIHITTYYERVMNNFVHNKSTYFRYTIGYLTVLSNFSNGNIYDRDDQLDDAVYSHIEHLLNTI